MMIGGMYDDWWYVLVVCMMIGGMYDDWWYV